MNEEALAAVAEEIAAPQPEQQEEAAPEQVQEAPPQEDPAERNWREARRKMEAMEAEIERLSHQRSQPAPQEEEYQFDGEEWVTGKDLKTYTEKHLAKEIDRRVQQHLQQREHQEAPTRLRSQYQDFDQVVNENALQQLKDSSPHLFETIMASSADPFKRGAAVYSLLKSQADPTAAANKSKLEANSQKPRSLDTTSGGSPLAAIGTNNGIMTEADKIAVQKRMRAIEGYI